CVVVCVATTGETVRVLIPAPPSHREPAWSQGINRKTCPHMSASSQPGGNPTPAISPRSLMLAGFGIATFNSTFDPLSHTTSRNLLVSQLNDSPTICPLDLIPQAILKQSPSGFRSVIWPFLHRVAWNSSFPTVKAPPTASPASLSQIACEKLPPSV